MNVTITLKVNSMSDALALAHAIHDVVLDATNDCKLGYLGACLDGVPVAAVTIGKGK